MSDIKVGDVERENFELSQSMDCPIADAMTFEREPDGSYSQSLTRLQWKVWQKAWKAASSPTPEGFAIVPKKLTEKMLKAFFSADDIEWDDVYIDQVDKLRYQYLCMVEAAPKPTDK